ncbi:HEAT repeat domain-containing protein [Haloarchaeobius sp. TZWSO28]|uniref:HEAT repeat domain-containing protein n=1 Tax=Haloarchaeobius sp. TZWSO28 TaxID=3446119 RepID=UPI003EC13B8B
MLGVSEENIVEHLEDRPPGPDDESVVTIAYNQPDPQVISDGIDRVSVVEEANGQYLVDYWGYSVGAFRTTAAGLEELGEELLTPRDEIPRWVVQQPTDAADFPWWIPDGYDPDPRIDCQACGRDTPAAEIVAPGSFDGSAEFRYCRACWNENPTLRHPEQRADGSELLLRAKELRSDAKSDPEGVDIEILDHLVRSENPDVQREALLALDTLIEDRPGDALDLLPFLTDLLQIDEVMIQAGALSCLSSLAEPYPRQVTPAAGAIVELLDTGDEEILDGALAYIAAVADAEPGAVVDAVPRIAAVLQSGTPRDHDAVVALTRIAKRYPEAVLPATTELLSYLTDDDSGSRVAALAGLGYIAKEYPNVAESSILTLTRLLDADAYRVRANAAGLLADLADEYPESVRPAVPRTVELLDDDDEKARYNATSILARIAKEYPEDIEPAIDPLIATLDDEFSYSRSNACWALGYLRADSAREALESLEQSDPDEEVRNTAEWALGQLEDSDE